MNDHLQVTRTDRGFSRLPELRGRIPGETVTIYESSLATEACVWLRVKTPVDRNAAAMGYSAETYDATVELTLERASELRDQLDWLIANHYQA